MGKGIRVVKVVEEPLGRGSDVALRWKCGYYCDRVGDRVCLNGSVFIQGEGREYALEAVEEVIFERQRVRFEEVEVICKVFDFGRNFLG